MYTTIKNFFPFLTPVFIFLGIFAICATVTYAVVPAPAASFTCSAITSGNTTGSFTLASDGTYQLSGTKNVATINIIQSGSDTVSKISAATTTNASSDNNKLTYNFTQLTPNATYEALAFDPAGDQIPGNICQFTTTTASTGGTGGVSDCTATITTQDQWDDCCDNSGATNQAPAAACDAFAKTQNSNCSAAITNQIQYDDCCSNGGGDGQAPTSSCSAYESANGMTAGDNGSCAENNITTDSCYIQNCTGNADADSTSCNTYATAYAIKDDGNTDCASITTDNAKDCCDNKVNSPMCMAFQDIGGGKGTPAPSGTPGTLNTPGSVGSGASGLIPCDGDDCTINSVMQLMNNLMTFFFKVLLLPLFVVMVISLGVGYLTANGKPGQHAKLASMAKHMVMGLLLMLCAWLIVKTILSMLGYSDSLGFFTKV